MSVKMCMSYGCRNTGTKYFNADDGYDYWACDKCIKRVTEIVAKRKREQRHKVVSLLKAIVYGAFSKDVWMPFTIALLVIYILVMHYVN